MKCHPLRSQRTLQQVRQFQIESDGYAREKFQDGDFRAKPAPNRAELETDRAGADHEKFFWRFRKCERFRAANDRLAIELRERQFDWNASGRNDDVLGLDLLTLAVR